VSALSDVQREVLTAVCDTVVPSLDQEGDADGFFARSASDVGAPAALEGILAGMPAEQQAGLMQLLDALSDQGFLAASRRSREQILRNVSLMGPAAAAGVGALSGLTLFLSYALPDGRGQNPFWSRFGYPGPVGAPPDVPRKITPLQVHGDTDLEADVCIVGSGAGGGVMAGVLSGMGLKVVVLEAGGYFDDADFNQLELPAFQNLYWRGGPTPTADMNVSLQAGACLGGGTVINWTNSLRTTPWVREQWEREFGLEGLAGPDFDGHLDAVWERLGVNDRCSELNGPQQRMKAGADALGWRFDTVSRNTDEALHSFDTAGFIGFGDQSGAKRSTVKTYLQDAAEHGAVILTRCFAERVLVKDGRAAGVKATWSDPASGESASVTVRAPQVVVACGSLESPALLLRSGIGGRAVGDYLRLHPCTAVIGYYAQDLQGWRGAPHAGLVREFENVEDGHGFLIEGAQYTTGLGASAVPFTGGEAHKRLMSAYSRGASFIGLLRDRGHGRVTVDADGMAVPWYSLTDEVDLAITQRSIEAQVRLHVAAGAQQIVALAAGTPTWREGDRLDPFLARIKGIPLRAGGWRLFSAHQMGSCRMGRDPDTSVAGPWGELHDTKGVWVGDASAFPTASGTNPMITNMALAHRNAHALAAAAKGTVAAAATA